MAPFAIAPCLQPVPAKLSSVHSAYSILSQCLLTTHLKLDLEHCLRCCAAQVLGLAGVNMGKQGFNFILDALADNSCLQRLDLSNNFIGSFHPQRYGLFQSQNKTLKLLDLRHNQLSYEWCMVLQQIAEMGLGRVIQL